MGYKKSYYLLTVGILGGAALAFTGLCLASYGIAVIFANAAAFLGVCLMLGGIVQALVFYRCPHCEKSLPIRGRKPDYCPFCGYKLDL